MLPCIIDLEASGFGRGSYPIEVGLCLGDSSSHCFLVRPEEDWQHWDPEAEKVHGISRDVLVEKGFSVVDISCRLNNLLKGQVVYTDAWGFDNTWLWTLYDTAGTYPNFQLETIRKLLAENQLPHWMATKKQVIADLNLTRHRASADAHILQETYRRIKAKF